MSWPSTLATSLIAVAGAAAGASPLTVRTSDADAHIQSVKSAALAGTREVSAAVVTDVFASDGRSLVSQSSPGSNELRPLVVLSNFFLPPGTYRVEYACPPLKRELPVYAEISVAAGQHYRLRCIEGVLHIEHAPNSSSKPTPLRGAA